MHHERMGWDPQPCRICFEEGTLIALIEGQPYVFCSERHAHTFEALATGCGGGLKKKRAAGAQRNA
jgi:hypothetical protein